MKTRSPHLYYAALAGLTCLMIGAACDAAAQQASSGAGARELLELPGTPAPPPAPPSTPQSPVAGTPQGEPATAPALPSAAPVASTPVIPAAPMPPAPPSASPMPAQMTPPPATAAMPPAMPPVPGGPVAPGGASGNAAQSVAAILAKNPDVLFAPTHLAPDVSLLFKKSDVNIIAEALAVYDKNAHAQRQQASGEGNDNLSSLINSLGASSDDTQNALPKILPNLYLGSIVYYSPGNWSVWINGRKLSNRTNQPDHEIYITRLSSDQVELVWRPLSLLDVPSNWQRLTDNGAHPIPNVRVDDGKGTITMVLRTNQTFVSHALAIREGLIKSLPAATSPDDNTTSQSSSASGVPNKFQRNN